jgi:hypothetical protein
MGDLRWFMLKRLRVISSGWDRERKSLGDGGAKGGKVEYKFVKASI